MDMSSKLWDFLKSKESSIHFEKSTDSSNKNFYLTKIPYNKSIDLLFFANTYGDKIGIYDKLEYSGIYNKVTEQLFDISYGLKSELLNLNWDEEPYPDLEVLERQFNSMVSSLVTNYVLDNKEEFYSVVKDYKPNISKKESYKYFMDNNSNLKYICRYHTDGIGEIVSYMDQGLPYLQKLVFDTIEKNRESIGKELKNIDKINDLLNEINNDKDDSIHKTKDIVDSISKENYGMVHLYINKKGKDFDFKYSADILKNNWDDSYISLCYVPVKQREELRDWLEHFDDVDYSDIYKIEYRGRAIYEDKNFSQYTDIEQDNSL